MKNFLRFPIKPVGIALGVILATSSGLYILFPDARSPILLLGLTHILTVLVLFFFRNTSAISTMKEIDQEEILDDHPSNQTSDPLVHIVRRMTGSAAVALTDHDRVIAFAGDVCSLNPTGKKLSMNAVKKSLDTGLPQIVKNTTFIECLSPECSCSYERAYVVPLYHKDQGTGTLILFLKDKSLMNQQFLHLGEDLSRLISLQMEQVESDRQAQLAVEARLDALQAQVNPHFLFNSLNAINMYVHKNPDFTRELIRRLSAFLRYTLGNNQRFTTIGDELKIIEDYLIIEKARFGDRLTVVMDVEENIKKFQIPVLSVQPLVNNAVIHGILPKEGPGLIRISIRRLYDQILVTVVDNGTGISSENLKKIYEKGMGTGLGVGIHNVHERLKLLFGEEYGLEIASTPGKGTNVSFKIPIHLDEGVMDR